MLNIFKKSKKEEALSIQATLKTGEVIYTDNEQGFVQTAEVYILSPEGDKVALGDGEYILQDDSSMVVKNGVIDSITAKEPVEEETPMEESEEMAEDAPVEEEKSDEPIESNDEIKKLDERISKLEELISKMSEKTEEVKAENENLKKEVVELSKQPAVQSISIEMPVSKPYEEMTAFEKYQYNKKSYGF